VADVALGRGAVEDSDGRRYCSVCAGKLRKQQPLQAGIPKAEAQKAPVILRPPAAAQTGRAGPPARTTPVPASRPSSRPPAMKPRRRDEREPGTITSRRLTSRVSTRRALPWYFRMSRTQWILAGAGGAGLLALLLIIAIAAASPAEHRERIVHRPVAGGSSEEIHLMMNEAHTLFSSGRRDDALRKLEAAKALARQRGLDNLVVELNQKIHGIRFKTAN
jgi:hypothetical protein